MNKRNLFLSLGVISLGAIAAFTFITQASNEEVTSEATVNVENTTNAETSTEAQVEKVITPTTPQTAEENAVNNQTGETTNEPTVVSPNESE